MLLPLLDGQGYLSVDESSEHDQRRALRSDGVRFFATANIGSGYTGTYRMDNALLNRFVAIHLDYPSPDQEKSLLIRRCPSLSEDDADRLVQIAQEQRSQAKNGTYETSVSTRCLLKAAFQISRGISFERAVAFCIVNAFRHGVGDEAVQLVTLLQGLDIDVSNS